MFHSVESGLGGPISGDTIDLVLEPGTSELIVRARERVRFNVQLTAYYAL